MIQIKLIVHSCIPWDKQNIGEKAGGGGGGGGPISPVGLFRALGAAGEEEDWCVRSIDDRDLTERGLARGDTTPTHNTSVFACCESGVW